MSRNDLIPSYLFLVMDLGQIILMLAVVFALAKSASFLFNRFGIPGLIGEILIGILIANLSFGDWTMLGWLGLETGNVGREIFEVIAELGVIFLLFSVGLETRVKDLMSVGRAAVLVAALGVVIPFILGYAYIEYLYDPGNMYEALFLGASMVATSVGITARVIKDMKLTNVKESRIIIGAAVIDDILGMIVLAIVAGMAESADGGLNIMSVVTITVLALAFVFAILIFCAVGIPWIHKKIEKRRAAKLAADPGYVPMKFNMLAVAILTCLAFSYLADYVGLASIIGAFLSGMLFADYAWDWKLEEKLESLNVFFVSFFFVYVGLFVELSKIKQESVMMLVTATFIVIVLAVIGKYVGCSLGAKMGDKTLDRASMNIIGLGMIPRGEVGIIIASIGYNTIGVMSFDLYVVVVMMSVITTIIAPPLLSKAYRKKYKPEYQITPNDQM